MPSALLPRLAARLPRLATAVLGAAALTLVGAPAAAQLSPSASGFSDAATQASESEYWLMMNELGACLAMQKPAQALAFVDTRIGSAQETEAFGKLFHPRRNVCMGNFVNAVMVRAHARGVVAEGLFERLPSDTVAAFIKVPPQGPEAISTLHDFARCYAVTQPMRARALLRETRVATKGEIEFISGMAPDFAPCLPAGSTLKLRPTSVRMAIAEALLRAATGRDGAQIQGTR